MDDIAKNKLISYLHHFGQEVKFTTYNYSDSKNPIHAKIKILMKEKEMKGLEREINKQLNVQNGILAHLKINTEQRLKDKKIRYSAQIIPEPYLESQKEKEEAIERFLHDLPCAIKNYSKIHHSKKRIDKF